MPLALGTRVGPYEIQSVVGTGGMGEVYRARDTRLGRDVAVKVVPAGITDPERLARFEQEARAAAALNHPNILAVFDLGTHDGAPFIVMELLEGETLRERLEAGPLPLRKAIDYVVQIARGLAAAHEKGIVHRDLKPDNVFVTSDERVKILDFGLAKLTHAEPTFTSGSMMATGIRQQTSPGMLMGTVAYMSPEQVRGLPADHRADIFALGALFYELITGRVAFHRETAAEVMTAVLREEPDLAAIGHPGVERLIRRCLEKNASARFQSALDLAFALESLDAAPAAGIPSTKPGPRRERIAWSLAALAFVVAAFALASPYWRSQPVRAQTMTFNVLPPDGWHIDPGGETSQLVAVSPDGRSLAFLARNEAGRAQLWIRPLASPTARLIEGTEGSRSPFWSRDGRWIAFFADGKLKKVEVSGGIPMTLCDAPTGTSGSWGADDVILFSQVSPFAQAGTTPGAGLWRISASGGEAVAATTVGPDERGHSRPYFLPDGRHFLYSAGNPEPQPDATRTVYVGELGRPDRTRLFTTDSLTVIYAAGYVLYLRGTTLVAHAFDPDRLVLSGEPIPIAEGLGGIAVAGGDRFGAFSASDAGVLAYHGGSDLAVHQLAWFERSGKEMSPLGERASNQNIELMPGDTRAAVAVVDPARRTRDLWMFDLARGVRSRATFDPAEERSAIGSPDGRYIAFNSNKSGSLELYVKSASGGGSEDILLQDGRSKDPMDWSPDGRFIVYRVTGSGAGNDVMVLPMKPGDPPAAAGPPRPLLATAFDENYARLSADGRWLAYTSDESGRYEVYVTSFPDGNGKWQISTEGGMFPRWRGDGRELYYVATGNVLSAVNVTESGGGVNVQEPRALFKISPPNQNGYPYAVTRDGQRFLVNNSVAPPNPLTVIVNWTASLTQ